MGEIKIYRGKYTNSSDIMYTWDGKFLYRGKYTNSSDIILSTNAVIPIPIIILSLT